VTTTVGSAFARLWHGLLAYLVKFGVVGLIGLVIDVHEDAAGRRRGSFRCRRR